MGKFTPGPWMARGLFVFDTTFHEESRHPSKTACIATVHPESGTNRAEHDAQLIAQAPAMVESLGDIIAALDKVCVGCEEICLPEDCNVNEAIELAETTLKKARGE